MWLERNVDMKDSFKNKNILVIIFELLIIALGIIGITFATSKLLDGRAATLITTDEYNLDYVGDNYVTISDIYFRVVYASNPTT